MRLVEVFLGDLVRLASACVQAQDYLSISFDHREKHADDVALGRHRKRTYAASSAPFARRLSTVHQLLESPEQFAEQSVRKTLDLTVCQLM